MSQLNKFEPEEYAIFGVIDTVGIYFTDLAARYESYSEEYQAYSRAANAVQEALDLLDPKGTTL